MTKDILLSRIREGGELSGADKLKLAVILSLPAILAQISSVLMSYIDASMVGRLGAAQSAAIGLVSTSTWVFGGFCIATASGFSVQIAHLIGSNDFVKARQVLRMGITAVLIFSLLLAGVGVGISGVLPGWLGGGADIVSDASAYFLIYASFLPAMQLVYTAGAMLQASGNMKVPSILEIAMCVLDVLFNYLFIFVADMGVKGAALGTGLAELVTAGAMLWFLLRKSPELNIFQDSGSFIPTRTCLKNAWGITGPMWLQNVISKGAYVASTVIVAPLGTIAIAANSFAIIAESFCYLPGYGISDAATALIGQSLGARRKDLAKSFSRITISMGAGAMTLLAVILFIFAPQLMDMLSNDPEVISLGAKVLRIEAFAETLYGVSIVGYGCCVGAGDTMVPSVINLVSMWMVRIGLAVIITPIYGLVGYWIAMCIELNVRGLLFLWRIKGEKWMKKRIA